MKDVQPVLTLGRKHKSSLTILRYKKISQVSTDSDPCKRQIVDPGTSSRVIRLRDLEMKVELVPVMDFQAKMSTVLRICYFLKCRIIDLPSSKTRYIT